MQVILMQDIKNVGKKEAVIEVKEGYARNYLFPKNLACDANPKNIKVVNEKRKQVTAMEKKEKEEASKLAEKLNSLSCTLYCQVGENDKLFGSITNQDIHKFLQTNGFSIDRHNILLAEPIKVLGGYSVEIYLHKDINATLKVYVEKKEEATK